MSEQENVEKMLRQYLKRDITHYSKVLNGIRYRFGCDTYKFLLKIYKAFGYPHMEDVWFQPDSPLGKIYGNIRDRRDKNLRTSPPFTYFDLDTLYAFDKFLEYLLKANRFYSLKDFDRCLREAKIWLLQNKGKAETGYYNERCPIVSLGKPENTMSEKTFENHYSEIECRRKLQEYLLSKHAPAKQESKKEDPKKGERLPGTFLPEDQLKFF